MQWWSWALRITVVAAGTVVGGVAINQILNDGKGIDTKFDLRRRKRP